MKKSENKKNTNLNFSHERSEQMRAEILGQMFSQVLNYPNQTRALIKKGGRLFDGSEYFKDLVNYNRIFPRSPGCQWPKRTSLFHEYVCDAIFDAWSGFFDIKKAH